MTNQFTKSDINEVTLKVLKEYEIKDEVLTEGDTVTLVDVSERDSPNGDTVLFYKLQADSGMEFTIAHSELEKTDVFSR